MPAPNNWILGGKGSLGNPSESPTIRSLAAEVHVLNCQLSSHCSPTIRSSAEKVQLDRQQFGPAATLFSLSPRCDMWGCDRCLAARKESRCRLGDMMLRNGYSTPPPYSGPSVPSRDPHTPNWERIAPLVFQCCNAHQTGSSSNVEVLPLRSPGFHSHRTGSSPT